ncbi:hypothetical protein [Erythrobacter tepidarius]|uniref:hypothetical protein n=1 Tax=Erythrobacter tepidarius TaxID=60454 RepID=UPI000A3ABB93|nr:hypothetical protein [Erythrobacter tepidarius]
MKAALPLLAAALALTACASAVPPPAPAPAPIARPAPASRPAPVAQAPVTNNWMDNPATPGDWRYAPRGQGSEASFWSPAGTPVARLRCLADTRSVVLSLPATGARAPLVTIRTETATRTLEATPADREMTVSIAAGDPLLDAMALSKGRFAVESEGLPALYLPSWAEVTRVIEDCR